MRYFASMSDIIAPAINDVSVVRISVFEEYCDDMILGLLLGMFFVVVLYRIESLEGDVKF